MEDFSVICREPFDIYKLVKYIANAGNFLIHSDCCNLQECYLNRGCDDGQVCWRIQTALTERALKSASHGSTNSASSSGISSSCSVKSCWSGSTPKASPRLAPRTAHRSSAAPVHFAIMHYAGPVTYSTVGMLEKNRDHVPAELVALLAGNSRSRFVRSLVADDPLVNSHVNGTMNGRRHTVLAKFKVVSMSSRPLTFHWSQLETLFSRSNSVCRWRVDDFNKQQGIATETESFGPVCCC